MLRVRNRLALLALPLALIAVGGVFTLTSAPDTPEPLVVWFEGRTEQMSPLVAQADTLVPGYRIELVEKQSLEDLEAEFDAASPAQAPDLIIGHTSLATEAFRAGRVVAPGTQLATGEFPSVLTDPATVDSTLVAVPFDTDVMFFVWNKSLFGDRAPTTVWEMTEWYERRPAGSLGLCVEQSTWGAQPFIDAIGGRPWAGSDTDPDVTDTGIGTPEFVRNLQRVNAAGDGAFLSMDCFMSFEQGNTAFALVGNWRIGAFDHLEYGVAPFPGTTPALTGRPWIASSVAAMTSGAVERGRGDAARELLTWFASRDGQLQMGRAADRLPARRDAVAEIGAPFTPAMIALVDDARPQRNDLLLGEVPDTGWFTILRTLFPESGPIPPDRVPSLAREARTALLEFFRLRTADETRDR